MATSDEFKEAMKKFKKARNCDETPINIGGGGGKLIFLIAFGLIALWGVRSSYFTVDLDEKAVIMRLGRYLDTYSPGLHFKIPFVDTIAGRINPTETRNTKE